MWGINCWMTCHCTETQISCRNIGLLIKKTSLIRDSTSVRAVWSFAGHRSQSARVPWREVAGIRNPPSPPSDHEEKKLHWSCLELSPLTFPLCCEASAANISCDVGARAVLLLIGEQLGDIATGGPMALNIINSWYDIILILTFRAGCKLSLHLSPGLY